MNRSGLRVWDSQGVPLLGLHDQALFWWVKWGVDCRVQLYYTALEVWPKDRTTAAGYFENSKSNAILLNLAPAAHV